MGVAGLDGVSSIYQETHRFFQKGHLWSNGFLGLCGSEGRAPGFHHTFSCRMNFEALPFDGHDCMVAMSSYSWDVENAGRPEKPLAQPVE